ncbi:MAG: arginyltransferase [Desulfobacterales bacterium]|nr:arginyltransferase [Desulfobacterales bacterium]
MNDQASTQKKLSIQLNTHTHECVYLSEQNRTDVYFSAETFSSEHYEKIINQGFRRSGKIFYKNVCKECSECIPIRIEVDRFRLSKSQKRALKKNQDIRIVTEPVSYQKNDFVLYKKYCQSKHSRIEIKYDYIGFLIDTPIPTEMMRYYYKDMLIGIGWIDILPNSLSSVYFAFDPEYSDRSLGVFSVLKEIELCKTRNKKWLQLGFWIESCPKMSYKNQYKPHELLINGKWKQVE